MNKLKVIALGFALLVIGLTLTTVGLFMARSSTENADTTLVYTKVDVLKELDSEG